MTLNTLTIRSDDENDIFEQLSSLATPQEIAEFGIITAIAKGIERSGQTVECPVEHSFVPGHYCRQITMPKGALVVSKKHKTWHPYTVTKGSVSVLLETEEGLRVQHIHLEPGQHFSAVTAPGTRRLILCREETVWTTFHPTEETDLAKIEEHVIDDGINSLE